MGFAGIAPVKRTMILSVESLRLAANHLNSEVAMIHRTLLTMPYVTECLFRKEHHVGVGNFDTALAANYTTKLAELPLLVQRHRCTLQDYKHLGTRPAQHCCMQAELDMRIADATNAHGCSKTKAYR